MAVLAGFVNRFFALPGKLTEMEVLPLSKSTCAILDKIGVWGVFSCYRLVCSVGNQHVFKKQ